MSATRSFHSLGAGLIHIGRRHRQLWREEQNRADEQYPDYSNVVDGCTPSAQRKRTLNELDLVLVELVGQDDRHVGEVQCWRRDIENGCCGLGGADGDAIQANAEEHHEPDRIDWRVGVGIDLGQEGREGERVVSGECVCHPGISQHR